MYLLPQKKSTLFLKVCVLSKKPPPKGFLTFARPAPKEARPAAFGICRAKKGLPKSGEKPIFKKNLKICPS